MGRASSFALAQTEGRPSGSGPPLTLDWPKYAKRAVALSARYPSAAEILVCYARLVDPDPTYDAPVLMSPELAAAIAQHVRNLAQTDHPPNLTKRHLCPRCGSPPVTAALRPEADGSRRSLICSRCAHEWPYQRLLCPSCQEQRFDELPVYIAPDYPHLRVECCATCKHYLIAADLVKDPEAIPLVEDIAALTLHVWATDHGYTKIEANLFGF